MTDPEIKKLNDQLWTSADQLRAGAHLAANKYGQQILGLIFLRYADILFKQHKEEIMAEYEVHKGGRAEKALKDISIERCGFYLPECAYYDFINDATDDANKATLVKNAMQLFIEYSICGYLGRFGSFRSTFFIFKYLVLYCYQMKYA